MRNWVVILLLMLALPFLAGFSYMDLQSVEQIVLESNTSYSFNFQSYYRNLAEISLDLQGDCSDVSMELYSNQRLISETESNVFVLDVANSKRKQYKVVIHVSSSDNIDISHFSNQHIVYAESFDDVMNVTITKIPTNCTLGILNQSASNIGFLQRHYPETEYPVNYISSTFPKNATPAISIKHDVSGIALLRDHITFLARANYSFKQFYEQHRLKIGMYISLLLFLLISYFYYGIKKASSAFAIINIFLFAGNAIISLFLPLPSLMLAPIFAFSILLYLLFNYENLMRLLKK